MRRGYKHFGGVEGQTSGLAPFPATLVPHSDVPLLSLSQPSVRLLRTGPKQVRDTNTPPGPCLCETLRRRLIPTWPPPINEASVALIITGEEEALPFD